MPKPRRRPALLALGICLSALGGLSGAWLANSAGDKQSVLALRRDVAFGNVLTVDDLTTVELSRDAGIAAIGSARLNAVVGQVAATQLVSGSLLTEQQVTAAAPPSAGQVLVALAMPPARLPAGSLQAGDVVLVVDTPALGADPPSLPPSTIRATVIRLGAPDANGLIVVDVTVAAADGPALAARSATGRIALVLQPRSH